MYLVHPRAVIVIKHDCLLLDACHTRRRVAGGGGGGLALLGVATGQGHGVSLPGADGCDRGGTATRLPALCLRVRPPAEHSRRHACPTRDTGAIHSVAREHGPTDDVLVHPVCVALCVQPGRRVGAGAAVA
ncbi:MAG: hypothetical protein JKY23_05990 [Nitrospinaceae bacterium]|nr:hypothetical protein [Nitrospinaceae bacterium]